MFRSNEVIDLDIEKRIVTQLIVSDKLATELIPITKKDFFRLDIAKTIFTWIQDFYNVYRKAPKTHIQDIYNSNKRLLSPTDKENIENFLSTLSKTFENETLLNEDYLLQETRKYLKKRQILLISDQMQMLANANLIDEAEYTLSQYGSTLDTNLSDWKSPLTDKDFIKSVFDKDEEEAMFHLGGVLDTMIGPIHREYLVLIMAPAKRGKTALLKEITANAIIHGRKVSFHSLEMNAMDIARSLYNRYTSTPNSSEMITYPIFDCILNQDNSCSNPKRLNHIPIPSQYSPNHPYKPCSVCKISDPDNFRPSSWYFTENRIALTKRTALKELETLKYHINGDNLRLKSYPVGSATIQKIDQDLKVLEFTEGWVPDIIVIDYADILAPEQRGLEGREKENSTWKALKSLAQTRRAAVITASQGNRASFKASSLEEENTSEDIRKLAHIDIALTINQTEEEKEKGFTRIGVLNHRWRKFNKHKQALILQQLEVAQFHLDSTFVVVGPNGDYTPTKR